MGLIRFLLALSVVFYHARSIYEIHLMGGILPVRIFFIISGFYMAMILNEKYVGNNAKYKEFILNRVLRIYPSYILIFVTFLITGYVSSLIKSESFITEIQMLNTPYKILHNIFLIGVDNFSLNPNVGGGLLVYQAWTLSIEILFYIIAPFLVRRSAPFLVLVGMISGVIKFFVYHWQIVNHIQPFDNFFFGELIFFVLGILTFKISRPIKKYNKNYLKVVYMLVLICIVFYSLIPISFQFRWLVLKDWLFIVFFAFLIPYIFDLFKSSSIDRFFGDLSYLIYLVHAFVFSQIINQLFDKEIIFLKFTTYILISIILAMVIYWFIDRQIYKLKQNKIIGI